MVFLWNRSDEKSHDVSDVFASREVVTGSPVRLLFGDILLGLDTMKEPVLADNLAEVHGVLEGTSPFLDSVHVITEVVATSDGVWKEPEDVTEVLNALDNVTREEIADGGLSINDQGINILHAATKFVEVVVTSESVDEAGSEVGHHVEGREGEVALDGADGKSQSVCKVDTGVEEELVIPVSFEGTDVALDLSLVEEPVLGESGSQCGGVCEDLSPLFDSLDILVHVLAGAERLGNLESGKTELESSLGIVIPSSFLDVSDSGLDFFDHEVATLVASLNLGEVVVSGHAVHESSDEVSASGN